MSIVFGRYQFPLDGRRVVPALFQLSFDHRDEIKRVGSGLGSCRELKRTSVDRRWDGETERRQRRARRGAMRRDSSLSLSPSAINGQKEKRWFSGITFRPRSLLTRRVYPLIIRRRTVCPRNRRIGGNAGSDLSDCLRLME